MAIYSNAYAEKVLSENPISFWGLDDDTSSTVTIPTTISTTETTGVVAQNIGMSSANGYYIGTTYYKNSSIPMVFGSTNTTILYPHATVGKPSLILPGYGFMNESNENVPMTFEFWTRIRCNTNSFRKIFGPINSNDGLYVKSGSLVLKIGNKITSHFVGEWFRPMLIQISITNQSAQLFLNGTMVGSINYQTGFLNFLTKKDINGKDQDYVGFYAYSDVQTVEIDAIAIYSYAFSEILASKRYVHGQGVDFDKNTNIAFLGETVFVDYSVSNYANNYNYPQVGKWSNGVQENIVASDMYVSSPDYKLPILNISAGTQTQDQFINDNYLLNTTDGSRVDDYINLVPSGTSSGRTWYASGTYLSFESLNILSSRIVSIFGIFKTKVSLPSSEQILFKLVNKITGNYIKISLTSSGITYTYNEPQTNGSTTTTNIVSTQSVSISSIFKVGLNLDTLQTYSNIDFRSFFGNPQQIQVLIGGEANGLQSFDGNIYQIGFCNAKNNLKISSQFNSTTGVLYQNGITYATDALALHYPSYGLILNVISNYAYLDIKLNGYWEDNVPLSLLAKNTKTSAGSTVTRLDFIQFNISNPVFELYSSGNYDTSYSSIKTFASFQYLQTGANDMSTLTAVNLSTSNYVSPDSTWESKKYELVDNTIIYTPSSANLKTGATITDLALVISNEFYIDGIINTPIRLRNMQLASQAYDDSVTNQQNVPINGVGTRFGSNIYLYDPSNLTQPFSTQNPYLINKQTEQYLSLTKNSGIKLTGTTNNTRCIMLPINIASVTGYNISVIEAFMIWNEPSFPGTSAYIFEINGSSETVYASISSSGQISVSFSAGSTNSADIYINGQKQSSNPTINKMEWFSLGIVFKNILNVDQIGYIKLKSNMLVNALSYFQLNPNKVNQQIILKTWDEVTKPSGTYITWAAVSALGSWFTASLKAYATSPAITPDIIYKNLVSTNRTVVDSDPKTGKILAHSAEYDVYTGATSSSSIYSVA